MTPCVRVVQIEQMRVLVLGQVYHHTGRFTEGLANFRAACKIVPEVRARVCGTQSRVKDCVNLFLPLHMSMYLCVCVCACWCRRAESLAHC